MPILTNSRREKFAQEFAKGKSATEAMREAGYTDPRNSTRLTKNDEVRRRVKELQNRGAIRTEVTVGSLVAELEDARQLAIRSKQASAAVAATMGKAKVTGQIVDRAEVGKPGELGLETAEECATAIVDVLAEDIEMFEELLERARRKRAASTQSAAGDGSSRH